MDAEDPLDGGHGGSGTGDADAPTGIGAAPRKKSLPCLEKSTNLRYFTQRKKVAVWTKQWKKTAVADE
jgi:hypothetical protein